MQVKGNVSKVLMTRREAAQRYAISLRSLDTLIAEGVLPTVRLGRRMVRIPVVKADAVVEQLHYPQA